MQKQILILTVFLCFLTQAFAQFPGQNGDFTFSSRASEQRQDHFYVEIVAKVGFNHMLYREQMSFSAEGGRLEVDWPQTSKKNDPFTNEEVIVYPTGNHVFPLKFFPANPALSQVKIKVGFQGCSNLTCFFPGEEVFSFAFASQPEIQSASPGESEPEPEPQPQATNVASAATSPKPVKVQTPSGLVDFASTLENQGMLWVLFLSLIGGLLVSLTPCVYPMIPITLSIIGGRNENQSFSKGLGLATVYVAGLSLTYAILGLAAASFGAQIRGFLQGTAFQALISVIFFLLALSMFDVFMIQAPASLRNRLGNIKKTGLMGIFFMGMVSGLMASPCVAAPLAGILAFIAATGSEALGFFMLLLFAWGMSVPLLLVGAFSGSLNALPKAGEWMNRVKEFYGFLMLGAALYFAQPLIGEPWAELLLALVLAAFAAFLGLFSNLPEDSLLSHRILKAFGIVTIAVACAFAISATTKWGYLCLPQSLNSQISPETTFVWMSDLDKAIDRAKIENKPVFVDFRADWCTICRELERNVFPRPEIKVLLEKMILVKVDATTSSGPVEQILQKFQVIGLPTLIIIGPDGQEMSDFRMVGDITPVQLRKNLSSAINQIQ